MSEAIIIAILEMVATHGIPAVMSGLQAMNKAEITMEDIEDLETLVKPPESYFKEEEK